MPVSPPRRSADMFAPYKTLRHVPEMVPFSGYGITEASTSCGGEARSLSAGVALSSDAFYYNSGRRQTDSTSPSRSTSAVSDTHQPISPRKRNQGELTRSSSPLKSQPPRLQPQTQPYNPTHPRYAHSGWGGNPARHSRQGANPNSNLGGRYVLQGHLDRV